MLFLPFFGNGFGVLVSFCFFPITIVAGEAACPVLGARYAAFVLGVFGNAYKNDSKFDLL